MDAPLGLVGHSFGGLTALSYANEDPAADVIVSLDGSIGTADGAALARRAGWTFPAVRAPLFDLHRATPEPRDVSIIHSL